MINHLWQSTVFAIAAGLLTLAFRRNRAQVRYWLWFCGSMKFLIPFGMLASLWPVHVTIPIAAPQVSYTIIEIAEPFPEVRAFPAPAHVTTDWLPIVVVGIWAAGFLAIALMRLRAWMRIRAFLRGAGFQPAADVQPAGPPVLYAPGLLEPAVIGIWRPVLLLPEGIGERLTPPQFEAVLAHEFCHVRRRDNLTSAIHMLVEAIFWFHPLVWWIGARLVEERELACDEEVLRRGSDPGVYAEGILKVCKSYVESPLRCVSGVTGADLKKRIYVILSGRTARELNLARKAALAVAGAAALAAPIGIGMLNVPASPAQTPAPSKKFEVASIKPCKPGDFVPAAGPAGRNQAKGGGGGSGPSPGRLNTGCTSVFDFIRSAYIGHATDHPRRDPSAPPLMGGPDWIRSESYLINAKAPDGEDQGVMLGSMMRALLEDRFQLKIHRESREAPIYDLVAAKGGPKLRPFQPGSCVPGDLFSPGGSTEKCRAMFRPQGSTIVFDAQAATMDDLSRLLTLGLDRPIVDKTGINGLFEIHLTFAIDDETPGFARDRAADDASTPNGASIFTAIQQQLGLKLEAGKGMRDFFVIDRVEKLAEN